MNRHTLLAVGVLAGGLACGPVSAQPTPPPGRVQPPAIASSASASNARLTLAEALELAWQRAVTARESDALRRRAAAERDSTVALWAAPPALELAYRDDRWTNSTGGREVEVGMAVPLWLPGQRQAAQAAAEGEMALVDASAQAARLRLVGELREAAWAIAAAQTEAARAEAMVAANRALTDDVQRRVSAGDLARADALAAQAEQLAAEAQHADALAHLRAARTRWTVLTGTMASPGVDTGDAMDAPAAATPDAHPERVLARLRIEQAQRRLALLQRSRSDAPELMLGLRQDTPGGVEPSRTSVVVGLRLPFGTDDRNRPLEAAARGDLDVAQTAEQRLREQLDGELAAAREALRSARAQAETESARARLLRERADLIDIAYRAGEASLPDLLRARAAAAQADGASARLNTTLGLAHARLQQALGLLP